MLFKQKFCINGLNEIADFDIFEITFNQSQSQIYTNTVTNTYKYVL